MDDDKALVKLLKAFGVKKLPDSKNYIMRMEIRGETRHKYIVAKRVTSLKRWECSCPGWIFKRKCKHITTMAPILDQVKFLTMGRPPKLIGYAGTLNAKKKRTHD